MQIPKRDAVPFMLDGDFYTATSGPIVSDDAKCQSVYNLTNRIGPRKATPEVAKDNRMVMYGLSDYIVSKLTRPWSHEDIDESIRFLESRFPGRSIPFDESMYRRVIRENRGWAPIKIEAVQEGSTFWPHEPFVQVTSLMEGFGEVAAMIEAHLVGMVSCAVARATIARHWLLRLTEVVKKHRPWCSGEQAREIASGLIHDFGMRASSTPEESEMYGRAHLLSFNGSDTTSASYQAWKQRAGNDVGVSVMALAHRIVQGHASELQAFLALNEQGGVGSYVADCYNFKRAVDTFLLDLAKDSSGERIVVRPDSGDTIANSLYIFDKAMEHGLYQLRKEDQCRIPDTMSFINGDSINPEKSHNIMTALADGRGTDPTEWGVFGVGGYLRNRPNRDLFSTAYKLAAAGGKPKVKLSETRAKMSVPGPTVLRHRKRWDDPEVYKTVEFDPRSDHRKYDQSMFDNLGSRYTTYYNGISKEVFGGVMFESFNEKRKRATLWFEQCSTVPEGYGDDPRDVLSDEILAFQDQEYKKHREG